MLGGQRPTQLVRAIAADVDETAGTITLHDIKGRNRAANPRRHVLPIVDELAPIIKRRRLLCQSPDAPLFSATGAGALREETLSGYVAEICADMARGRRAGARAVPLRDLRRTRRNAHGRAGDIQRRARADSVHGLGGIQQRHYDKHDYMAEKRAAIELWTLRMQGKAATVTPIKRPAQGGSMSTQRFNPWPLVEAWAALQASASEPHRKRWARLSIAQQAAQARYDAAPVGHSPADQVAAAQECMRLRPAIAAGDGGAVLDAVAYCAAEGLLTPQWLADAYLQRHGALGKGEARDWSDENAFGQAYPKGTELKALQQDLAENFNYSLQWWEQQQLQEVMPNNRYLGALVDPRSGHLHPLKYTQGLAKRHCHWA